MTRSPVYVLGLGACLAGLALIATTAEAWGPADGRGWWRHDGGRGGLQRLCDGGMEDRLAVAADRGRHWLGLRADQEPAFDALIASVRETLPRLRRSACPSDGKSPVDGLTALDRGLAAGREAIVAVRPAWDAFRASLDDRQRALLEETWRR